MCGGGDESDTEECNGRSPDEDELFDDARNDFDDGNAIYDMPYDIMVVAAESDDIDTSYQFSVCLIIIYDCCMRY